MVTFERFCLNLSLIWAIAFLNASALEPEFHAMTLMVTAPALPAAGAHGIGRGTALAFAREGAKIVINDLATDLSAGHAQDVAQLIREQGSQVEVFLGDASETADMQRVVASTVERYGRLDILINNANP